MSDREERDSAALAAARLRRPVRELTRLGVDEWTVRRMWEDIQRRSAGHGATAPARPRRRGATALVLSLGLVLVVTLTVGASWLLLGGSTERSQAANAAVPLLTKDGHRFEALEAASHPAQVAFADGSRIEASPGARVEGLAATGSEFVLLVRQGRARFSVTPGGPRRWLIETKSARVEVVGTVLSVENGPDFVEVRVDAGVVLVRSPLLSDGVQRVQAGQSLRLQTPAPAQPREAAPHPHEVPRDPAPRAAAPAKSSEPAERPVRRRPGTSAAELWTGADEARQSGDAARAAALLERLLYEHPGDSQAALGAYTLGVLQLEQLGRPRAAAQRFAQALELGLATGLEESCYVRRAEALRQAGDVRELRRVASEYLRRFPTGAQREAMQGLLKANAAGSRAARTPGSL